VDQPTPTPSPPSLLADGLNTLRAILVALAFLAGIYLAVVGQWFAASVMAVGVVAHGLMWVYLHRLRSRPSPPQG
jgi:hypothetical protein